MTSRPEIIQFYNVFVDGWGLAGKVSEITPPEIIIKNEEFEAAGMGGPDHAQFGIQALKISMKLFEWTPKLMGLLGANDVGITLRAAAKGGADFVPNIITMRGRFMEQKADAWKSGAIAGLDVTAMLTCYKNVINGKTVHDIDIYSMVRNIGGIDQLSGARAILNI